MSSRTLFLMVAAWLAAGITYAAPTVNSASLRGLQIGGSTTITFDGSDLLPDPKVVLPFTPARQTVLPGASATRVQIEIALDETTPPGIYPLRLANAKGISSTLAMGVDRLTQQPLASQITALPVAFSGTVNGAEIQRTTFSGKKDERLLVDVESRRLGANLKPVLRLYDQAGRQVAWSPQRPGISGDARLEVTLPADGAYTVELHDLLYKAAAPGYFRLKIGALAYADLAFPVAVQQGTKASLSFSSTNLPPDARAELDATSSLPFLVDRPAALPAGPIFTGAAPRVIVSGHPEVVETALSQGQAIDQLPVGISGRLDAAGQEDQFLLTVSPGAKLRFDVQARRIGSPLDGVLSVRGEKGEQPMSNDDRPGVADPGLDYTVPGNVNKVVVSLKDLHKRGGDDFIYRIVASDLSRPDFSLVIDADKINVPAGSTQVVKLQVNRQGYSGPIKISGVGLPMALQLAGTEIPAGATLGLVTLTAAAGTHEIARGSIVGTSDMPSNLVRAARLAETPVSQRQPWLRSDIGLAVSDPGPIGIAWMPGSDDEKLPLGNKLPAKLQLSRTEGTTGQIRVSMLTTQVMPKKKVKENNQDKEVNDVDRALRLDGTPTFGPDVKEASVTILTPGDLPSNPWGLVLVAELLAADGKTVVATSATPARLLSPIGLLVLEMSSADKLEGKSGLGDTGKVMGKLTRASGFAQPAVVTLAGLPEGVVAPKVEVPADKSEFMLPLSFPYGTKLGEMKNVKLVATAPDSKQPAETIRSNELALTINVVQGEKPPE